MLNWSYIDSEEIIEKIASDTSNTIFLIFKHSTRCSISSMSLNRLETKWDTSLNLETYFLDLIKFRNISNKIAERFNVYHESPQVLLIKNGKCFFDCSHNQISVNIIKEQLA
jgi:bacillithiol system protein YtxJ